MMRVMFGNKITMMDVSQAAKTPKYQPVGALLSYDPKTKSLNYSTAFLISPRVILTAASSAYDRKRGINYTDFIFYHAFYDRLKSTKCKI
jgi:V8-like Glu-specific endopeptidase